MSKLSVVFVDLLKDSYIIRGVITTGLTGAVVYLWVMQLAVPDSLFSVWLVVIGYYFGVVSEKVRTK